MRTILIFGDSTALGYNAPSLEGWAHHLKKFLEERDPDVRVINHAVDGENTKGILAYIEKESEKSQPSEIILAVGINDSLYSFTDHRQLVPREQFEKNLTDILQIAQKYAKKIIVLGIIRVDERHSVISDENNIVCQYQNITIQKYNDSLRSLAQSSAATFVDVYSLLNDDELDDGYHPNGVGHQKIYKEIAKAL